MSDVRKKPMVEQQTTNFPSKTRCEFCDVTFKCDLDVSRHLNSASHMEKRDRFIPYVNPNSSKDIRAQREIPKTISQLFEKTIRVRNMKDIRDLADKGYFQIKKGDKAVCDIAQALNKKLFEGVVRFESRSFPPEYLERIESIFVSSNENKSSDVEEEAEVEEPTEVDSSRSDSGTTRANHEPPESHPTKRRKTPAPEASSSPSTSVRSSDTRSNFITSTSNLQPSTSARAGMVTLTPSPGSSTSVRSETSTAAPTPSTSAQSRTHPRIQNPDTNPNPASTFKPTVGFWPGVRIKEEPKDD